ncbi:MAG: outer membrane beta-barrel protein, partial [Mangrovibacterium sp.]
EMSRPGNKQHLEAGGGLQVEYHAGKRWSIHSGLLYSRLGQSSGSAGNNRTLASDQPAVSYFNNKVYLESPGRLSMNASAGVIEMNRLPDNAPVFSPMESGSGSSLLVAGDSFDQRFEYLEIPLLVGFRLTDRHWNVHFLGGFSANFLLGNQVYLNNGNGSTLVGKTRDMAVLNYAAILGMGMKYRLSRRICFQLEPRLKYYLESLSNNPDVSFKPYSVGIHTGISYRF